MKVSLFTKIKKLHAQDGAGLLLAVLFFAFFAVAACLATYLALCRNEYTSVSRSQTWNTSMVLAEAGVEEGLAFVNQNANGAVGTLGDWPSSASANGWSTVPSANTALYPAVYTITRNSLDPALGSYTVYVTNVATAGVGPTILSIGTANWNSSRATLTAGNTKRTVLVDTSGYSQGSEGIIAWGSMSYKGANVEMDSWDSADPNHSIWQTTMTYHGKPYGLYSDTGLSYSSNSLPSHTSDVMVATDGTILNAGNATIYGFAQTGPGGGLPTTGSQGSVGDLNWVQSGQTGVEPGHGRDDMNETFYSKSLPNPQTNGWQTTWRDLPATLPANAYFKIGGTWTNMAGIGWTNVGGTQYHADSSGGATLPTPGSPGTTAYYQIVITNMYYNTNWVFYDVNSLSANVFVDAPYTVLWCSNGMTYTGNSTITLNTNADITIYSEGGITTGGNGNINNGAQYAKAFSIYDVVGNGESISFGGNGIGTGYVYTPSSNVSFNGGGNSNYGFVGALFCNTVTITGHYSFHFDEVFDQISASDQYLPTMWQEVQ